MVEAQQQQLLEEIKKLELSARQYQQEVGIHKWLICCVEQIRGSDRYPRGATQSEKSELRYQLQRILAQLQTVMRNLQYPSCLLPEEGRRQLGTRLAEEVRGALREQRAWTSHDLQ